MVAGPIYGNGPDQAHKPAGSARPNQYGEPDQASGPGHDGELARGQDGGK